MLIQQVERKAYEISSGLCNILDISVLCGKFCSMDNNKKDKGKKASNVIKMMNRASGYSSDADRATDIFAESIKEEIQQENWQNLWNKYGVLVTSVIAGIMLAISIYSVWQRKDLEEREAISVKFTAVQNAIMSGDPEQGIEQLKELSHVDNKSYALLAKMEYAAILARKNDKQSLEIYKSIFEDQKADNLFKNLAYILYTNSAIDLMDAKTLNAEIGKIIETLSAETFQEGPWSLLAKESLSFCYIKVGQNENAKKVLENLVKTDGIPDGIAERSRMLIQSLGE